MMSEGEFIALLGLICVLIMIPIIALLMFPISFLEKLGIGFIYFVIVTSIMTVIWLSIKYGSCTDGMTEV